MGNKKIDPIPDKFSSYEEAAEFWDTHDTTDYLEYLTPVDIDVEFKKRRFEIEIDDDVMQTIKKRARKLGVTTGYLANDLLRKQIS